MKRNTRTFKTEVFNRRPLFCVEITQDLDVLNWKETLEFFKKLERTKGYRDFIKKHYPKGETEETGSFPIKYYLDHPIPNISLCGVHFSTSKDVEYQVVFTNVKGLSSAGKYAFVRGRTFEFCGSVASTNYEKIDRRKAESEYIQEYRTMAYQLFLIERRGLWERIKEVFSPSRVVYPKGYFTNFPSIWKDRRTEKVLPGVLWQQTRKTAESHNVKTKK